MEGITTAESRAYAQSLGGKLRQVRQELGLSLQRVEEKSNGRWKAVVVGSYERADRAITVARLFELADFYGVPIADLLPTVVPPSREEQQSDVIRLLRRALSILTWEAQ